jgi:hypothetical protein
MVEMKHVFRIFLFIWVSLLFLLPLSIWAEEKEGPSNVGSHETLTLVQAEMCEAVDGKKSVNQAIVFSKTRGKVCCLTVFDPVPEKTFIYHDWFFKDHRKRRVKLSLESPRWATFSRTEIREADRGPWRVEIRDDQDNILALIRFSITD